MDLGERIQVHLAAVAAERARREHDGALHTLVLSLKSYQQQRFRNTYSDLLTNARYAPAARFFLDELYGPEDFTRRDEQFGRIVGPLVRLFPRDIVATVERLAALHALSERLDTAMADHARGPAFMPWSRRDYVVAWQAVGRREDREHQVALLLHVGGALDRLTRNQVLRHSLRAMRGPAKAAGLGELQAFIEAGFDTFRRMRGAQEFLQRVEASESALCQQLFSPGALRVASAPVAEGPLGQLP